MESLNSDNSLQPEQPSCTSYSIVPPENMVNTQVPLLKPAAEPQPEVQIPQSQPDNNHSDWAEGLNSEQEILVDTEFKKLLALNQELREANNQLYEEVEHLKDDLAESEKALQWQKRRSSVAESMLNQQTQELAAAQEQIKSLFQELEKAVQTVQRQENFIETYKSELQITQQRLAQLERECALLQTNYNEQCQQALQSENTCRELRSRLMRQQRQTLQFKAALEKCLDTPVSDESSEETTNHQTRFSRKARSLFPNVQPIRPWSAESEGDLPIESPWGQYSTSPVCSRDDTPSMPSSGENLPVEEDTPSVSEPVSAEIEDTTSTSATSSCSSLGSSHLDAQLDSLIQMFFTNQSVSASATSAPDTEMEETSPNHEPQLETPDVSVNNFPESLSLSVNESNAYSSSEAAIIGEDSQVDEGDVMANPSEDYLYNHQSPSPVVYPHRPPKGRKSLSSVELPNFRPNQPSQSSS
jgi:myosin heavy subunit